MNAKCALPLQSLHLRFAAEADGSTEGAASGQAFLRRVRSNLSAMEERERRAASAGGDMPGLQSEQACDVLAMSISVELPRNAAYSLWTTDSSLPYFMRGWRVHELLSESRMTWLVPFRGGQVAWDAEVCDDIPYARISWQSFHGRPCPNWGFVQFDPNANGGTLITVGMEFETPCGPGDWNPMKTLFSRLERNLERLGTMQDADGRWSRILEGASQP